MNLDEVYKGSIVLMWTVTLVGVFAIAFYVRKLRAATRDASARIVQAAVDGPLAQWCRTTNLTVITVTGTEFTIPLAELQQSANPFRSWNVPVSVALWSDPADKAHAIGTQDA